MIESEAQGPARPPLAEALTRRRFAAAAAIIIGFFLLLEIAYAFRLPRVMDEFTGARYVYLTATRVPYRDFQPSKTVLAYYLQAPPVLLIRSHWNAMTGIKIELAILWALALAAGAATLSAEIDFAAVLGALAMTTVMSTFAERATEIRPDAVAAMFGLASLLALIRRRPGLAGLLCAASFCSTQKGIYFALAGGLALIAVAARDRTRQAVVAVARYALLSVATVGVYFGLWMVVASPAAVIGRVLSDKYVRAAAVTDVYADLHARFWTQTLLRNPLFYAVAFVGLVMLIPRWSRRSLRADVVVPYAVVLSALCVWHKQPWPYFFVFLIPTLFAVIALALGELRWNRKVAMILVATSILIPLARLRVTLTRDLTAYQKSMVDAAEQLLGPGETYIDGMNMLFRREQASPEFNWIDAVTLAILSRRSDADLLKLVRRADSAHPKLVIWNYRIAGLPPLVMTWLSNRFEFSYGDLMLYAPRVRPPGFALPFDGDYLVSAPVIIDGRPASGAVRLSRGPHSLAGAAEARLRLLPPAGLRVDPAFRAPRSLFDRIYDY